MTKTAICMASNAAERARLLVTLLAASLLASSASADTATARPRCSTVPAGVAVADPAKLPPAIVTTLHRELGEFALPDEPFNPTDVVELGVENRRILFVWRKAERWVVASERGGRGYNNPVLALDGGEENARIVANRTVYSDRLCETAAALLD